MCVKFVHSIEKNFFNNLAYAVNSFLTKLEYIDIHAALKLYTALSFCISLDFLETQINLMS